MKNPESESHQPHEPVFTIDVASYDIGQSYEDVYLQEQKTKDRNADIATLAQSFEDVIGKFGVGNDVSYRHPSGDSNRSIIIPKLVTPRVRTAVNRKRGIAVDVSLGEIISMKRTSKGYEKVVDGYEATYYRLNNDVPVGNSSAIYMWKIAGLARYEVFNGQRVEMSEDQLNWANRFVPQLGEKLGKAYPNGIEQAEGSSRDIVILPH